MKTLLIETSTERGIVAIVEEGHCLYVAGLPFGYQNSRFLLPKIEEGFETAKIKAKDLDLIAVGKGPGSYTGTRVGVVTAKSLAYASKLPLVGVSTLKGFIPDKDGSFAAILDAKLSGVIFQKGTSLDGVITYHCEPELMPIEKAGDQLCEIELLLTPNEKRIRPALAEAFPKMAWEWEETAPGPLHMVDLALEEFKAGNYSTDASLDITYFKQTP